MKEKKLHDIFCYSKKLWTQYPKSIMARKTKKSILQLKYLIRFAQALFKPKGNSIEKFYTLEGILDIRTN